MYMNLIDWKSPLGVGYELWRGWQIVEEGRFLFDKDVVKNREDAMEGMPFVGDSIQAVIDEHHITNAITMSSECRDIVGELRLAERSYTGLGTKGKAVWFPVGNGIEVTDPFLVAADPAMGYVKSVNADNTVMIDVRQAYRRTNDPNIVDESRKMEPLTGTACVDMRYCFENRRECMDYIIAQSAQGNYEPVFRVDVTPDIRLTNDDIADLSEPDALIQK